MKPKEPRVVCHICKEEKKAKSVMPAEMIRDSIAHMIRKNHPDLAADGFVCIKDLNFFRMQHIHEVLRAERGELGELEEKVIESLTDDEPISQNPYLLALQKEPTRSERLSDRIAEFGGSWKFILTFCFIMVAWIALNSIPFLRIQFDPYPYILLNLLLSCLAALQAPVIMMAQNRRDGKDRARAEHDYQINLKAELEIRDLHQKMDHLRNQQWYRLLELYRSQIELLEQLLDKKHSSSSRPDFASHYGYTGESL